VSYRLILMLLFSASPRYFSPTQAGCDKPYTRPPSLDVDYGTPTSGVCTETGASSGIFVRNYTRADVTMDCNTFTASIVMKPVLVADVSVAAGAAPASVTRS
jgi:hypothetical protein